MVGRRERPRILNLTGRTDREYISPLGVYAHLEQREHGKPAEIRICPPGPRHQPEQISSVAAEFYEWLNPGDDPVKDPHIVGLPETNWERDPVMGFHMVPGFVRPRFFVPEVVFHLHNTYELACEVQREHEEGLDDHSGGFEPGPPEENIVYHDARETIRLIDDAMDKIRPLVGCVPHKALLAVLDMLVGGVSAGRLPVWGVEPDVRAARASARGLDARIRGRKDQAEAQRKKKDPTILECAEGWMRDNPTASRTHAIKTLMAICEVGRDRLLRVAGRVLPPGKTMSKKCTT
jgi:hypothetical protein